VLKVDGLQASALRELVDVLPVAHLVVVELGGGGKVNTVVRERRNVAQEALREEWRIVPNTWQQERSGARATYPKLLEFDQVLQIGKP
jgi:hypothetical protein